MHACIHQRAPLPFRPSCPTCTKLCNCAQWLSVALVTSVSCWASLLRIECIYASVARNPCIALCVPGPQNHTCLQCTAKESAQDASPPVVIAIKENVENASISTVTDLPPVKKMRLLEVAMKQKCKMRDLPECLSSFSLENKDWVTFGLEISPQDINLPQEEVVAKCVAQQITVPATEDAAKPTTFVLSEFTIDQLRKVATKFGCVGIGSKSKFDVRMAISIKLTVHNWICGASLFQADEETCSQNTGIHMQNATFHVEHRKQFIMSNDIKKHKDFERGAGRNGENLYALISNMVNDCECHEDIGKAEISNDPTNHLHCGGNY